MLFRSFASLLGISADRLATIFDPFQNADATQARDKLGWVPEITARQMCQEMVASDLAQARQNALLRNHGTLTVGGTSHVTQSATISGTGGLTKDGAGAQPRGLGSRGRPGVREQRPDQKPAPQPAPPGYRQPSPARHDHPARKPGPRPAAPRRTKASLRASDNSDIDDISDILPINSLSLPYHYLIVPNLIVPSSSLAYPAALRGTADMACRPLL